MSRRAFPVALALFLAAAAHGLAATKAKPMVLPFVEDDYGKALAEASQKKLPIFIEAWAPW